MTAVKDNLLDLAFRVTLVFQLEDVGVDVDLGSILLMLMENHGSYIVAELPLHGDVEIAKHADVLLALEGSLQVRSALGADESATDNHDVLRIFDSLFDLCLVTSSAQDVHIL